MNTLADLQDAFDELTRRAEAAHRVGSLDTASETDPADDPATTDAWRPARAPHRSRRLAPLVAVAAVAAIAGGVALLDARPWSDRSRTVQPGTSDNAMPPYSLMPGMTPDD